MIQLNELFRLKDGYRPANFIVRKTVINPEHLVYVKDVTPNDLKYYSKIKMPLQSSRTFKNM